MLSGIMGDYAGLARRVGSKTAGADVTRQPGRRQNQRHGRRRAGPPGRLGGPYHSEEIGFRQSARSFRVQTIRRRDDGGEPSRRLPLPRRADPWSQAQEQPGRLGRAEPRDLAALLRRARRC